MHKGKVVGNGLGGIGGVGGQYHHFFPGPLVEFFEHGHHVREELVTAHGHHSVFTQHLRGIGDEILIAFFILLSEARVGFGVLDAPTGHHGLPLLQRIFPASLFRE